MTSPDLAKLVGDTGLQRFPAGAPDLANLLASGQAKLRDAMKTTISPTSRFDLAYNAAHALALAALRHHGYRSKNRIMVFQTVVLTAGLPNGEMRVLVKAHHDRNRMEYEGEGEVDQRFLDEVIQATAKLEQAVRALLK